MDNPGDGHVEELPLNEPRCYPNYISESVASDCEEDYIVLKIRLRRTGAKKQPRYRVVVAESSAPRDGAFVEILGWYNPQADPAQVVINTEKAAEWIKRGAQPSDRVAYLLQQAGAGQPEAPVAEPGPAEVAEVEVKETTASARGRSRTKRASAETAAAATSEQGEGGAAAAPAVSGVAAEIPASEAPEEEGSAGASSS